LGLRRICCWLNHLRGQHMSAVDSLLESWAVWFNSKQIELGLWSSCTLLQFALKTCRIISCFAILGFDE
jgi:hypothetical protein